MAGLGAMAGFAMMLKPAIMAKVELIAVMDNSCYNIARSK